MPDPSAITPAVPMVNRTALAAVLSAAFMLAGGWWGLAAVCPTWALVGLGWWWDRG